ncbi:hypothetical protein M378DRAFT_640166 [Amanita muscaria Koide BX008]|uniref:Uncharacterized protein n=1 Tax=Amanita muscaria (strain Koide BX008) TaxID=946122 RepID=A0A0C2SMT0_AMAMK|nr:hypothetical protein M378DRAFT_640166 [Amanita muscaria Koide BX008]
MGCHLWAATLVGGELEGLGSGHCGGLSEDGGEGRVVVVLLRRNRIIGRCSARTESDEHRDNLNSFPSSVTFYYSSPKCLRL